MATNDQQPAVTDSAAERRDALVARLFQATLGFLDLFGVYLGDRLGLYRALAEIASATSTDLAERTGTDERYVREWLEQQAACGIVEVQNVNAGPEARRFTLP